VIAFEPTVPESRVLGLIAAYERDAPLAAQFPVRLVNGRELPAIHLNCSCCGRRLPDDTVHGRLIQSLPHVVTVEANGLCEPCNRLTHLDCRVRANDDQTLIEWLGSNGRWMAREYRPPSWFESAAARVQRMLARVASTPRP
jgi:hypothetical protein